MKGVILQETDARLVDVAHDFPRQDVRATAFWLREVLPYFPPAVHLVVVDPGVGTDRAAVVVRAGNHALVGPDNGVLLPAARRLTGDALDVYEVTYADPAPTEPVDRSQWPPVAESSTFHGRDVFAPAAAQVHAAGVANFEVRAGFLPADDYIDLALPEPSLGSDGAVGEVLAVDGFGNVITNLPGDVLADRSAVEVDGVRTPVGRAYAATDPGDTLVTVGSHGNVELAVNRGRGDEAFAVDTGDRIRLSW